MPWPEWRVGSEVPLPLVSSATASVMLGSPRSSRSRANAPTPSSRISNDNGESQQRQRATVPREWSMALFSISVNA